VLRRRASEDFLTLPYHLPGTRGTRSLASSTPRTRVVDALVAAEVVGAPLVAAAGEETPIL
jgi:hypothetical protein